ncbi:MAG: hypothetical protein IH790_08020 [Acidobacteria bacterium]|nr:hypothetical protein [Acidobacteriota bacterium]
MDERLFCDESKTTKPAVLYCQGCGEQETYQLCWLVRRKKKQLSAKAHERARSQFEKFQSYMVLIDDVVMCGNPRCRRRIEISGIKTTAYLTD